MVLTTSRGADLDARPVSPDRSAPLEQGQDTDLALQADSLVNIVGGKYRGRSAKVLKT